MEIDFRRYEGTHLDSDICLIGAGAAGIAIACGLRDARRDVLLVESGGLDPAGDTAVLSCGETEGLPFTGLTEGRVRAFGGTTRLWAGQCIRLDALDYERRDWVPDSGWPLTAADLAPFYDRAERFVHLHDPVYDARLWRWFGLPDPGFDSATVTPKFTIYCRQPDFKTAYLRALRHDATVRVLLNATATRLNLTPDGGRVQSAELRSLDGRHSTLTARVFILCGGGVENPRLLLASNDIVTNGIGNGRDLVGRFFLEHPNGRTAELKPGNTRRFQEQFGMLYRRGERFWPKLALGTALQRRLKVLNANAYPVYDYPEGAGISDLKTVIAGVKARRFDRDWARSALGASKAAPAAVRESVRWALRGRAPVFAPSRCWLQAHIEQAPDRDNRVSLAHSTDAFGVPKPKVRWRIGELEHRTLRVVVKAVADELARTGLARMEVQPWLERLQENPTLGLNDAFHHAGTTRMAASAVDGVVNLDCRVHEVGNLYIAGGSVFPTCGYANPTLTIIALGLRLADHLSSKANLSSHSAGAWV